MKEKFFTIEKYRVMFGYSQRQMGMLIGVQQGTYSNKVTRRIPFTSDELLIIHSEFNKNAKKNKLPEITMNELLLS